MTQDLWDAVDRFFAEQLIPDDPVLEAVLADCAEAGLPQHDLAPNQAKLLSLLARLQGSRNILEIGTLGGYSAIWLARALPDDGRLITLEIDPAHAEVARRNLARAGLGDRAEVRVGRAVDSLAEISAEGLGPFDLVFIDADKPSNPEYLAWALRLTRVGSLIVADNVVREGAVIDFETEDEKVLGVRRFAELMGAEPRLAATAIQTVGTKGHDGFALALVTA